MVGHIQSLKSDLATTTAGEAISDFPLGLKTKEVTMNAKRSAEEKMAFNSLFRLYIRSSLEV